jgi:hypothetical protein
MQLSTHFDLDEFTISEYAIRNGIDNTPNDDILDNLRFLCSMLEEVRSLLDKPMIITSGYRCPKLNSAIGGSKNSQHTQGLAADFICPQFGTPYQVAEEIMSSNIRFDQLIHEGKWAHISMSETPRREVLTAKFMPKVHYLKGLQK